MSSVGVGTASSPAAASSSNPASVRKPKPTARSRALAALVDDNAVLNIALSTVSCFSYDEGEDGPPLRLLDAAARRNDDAEGEGEGAAHDPAAFTEFPDMRAVLQREFASKRAEVMQACIQQAWWSNPAQLAVVARRYAAGEFTNNAAVHPLSAICSRMQPLDFFGSRVLSLSGQRLANNVASDFEGLQLDDDMLEEVRDQSTGSCDDTTFAYFSFALIDADGCEYPLMAEHVGYDGNSVEPRGLIYSFEAGAYGRVVGSFSEGDVSSNVKLDLTRLRAAMPSLQHYRAHDDTRHSFLRHWQLWAASGHFEPACASVAGPDSLHAFRRRLRYSDWFTIDFFPPSLSHMLPAELAELESNPAQLAAVLAADPEFDDAAQMQLMQACTQHAALMARLSTHQRLQLELEESAALGLKTMSRQPDATPNVLPLLREAQTTAVREHFTKLVRAAMAPAIAAPSSSSAAPASCSSPAAAVSSSASSSALIPNLEGLVHAYAPLDLPYLADRVPPEPDWSRMIIIGKRAPRMFT